MLSSHVDLAADEATGLRITTFVMVASECSLEAVSSTTCFACENGGENVGYDGNLVVFEVPVWKLTLFSGSASELKWVQER